MLCKTGRFFVIAAAISGFLATALGAFCAHALKNQLSIEMLSVFQVGIQYQFYHTLTLMLLVGILSKNRSKYLYLSGYLFLLGIILFSGSLYLYVITNIKLLVFITPIGGVMFLLAWLALAFGVLRNNP